MPCKTAYPETFCWLGLQVQGWQNLAQGWCQKHWPYLRLADKRQLLRVSQSHGFAYPSRWFGDEASGYFDNNAVSQLTE